MSDRDKVVHAFPGTTFPENLMEIERNETATYHCNHEKVSLNEHDRTVLCAKCKATLDPFNFLMHNAKTIQMAWYNYKTATQEVSKLHERIGALKKEEKSLRDKVKRLNEKTGGDFINVRGHPL
jgi:hypothetical protein